MAGDTFADLEMARQSVLGEAARFVEELGPILRQSLRDGFDRLSIRQAAHLEGLDEGTRTALELAIDRASDAGVDAVGARLRPPDIWLAPFTAPHMEAPRPSGWPLWLPAWLARLGRGRDTPTLGALDDPSNRIWVAISSAAIPLDPVLREFGFEPERRRLGGGSFGISARTLPQLDPSGTLQRRWRRYRAAYERLVALTHGPS